MKDVNAQAKNDVKELLDEYVVNPISKTFSEGITKNDEKLIEIENKVSKIDQGMPNRSEIRKLENRIIEKLDEKTEEIYNTLVGTKDDLHLDLESVRTSMQGLGDESKEWHVHAKEEFDQIRKELSDEKTELDGIKKEQTSSAKKILEQNAKEVREAVQKIENRVLAAENDISGKCTDLSEQLKKLDDITEAINKLEENGNEKYDQIMDEVRKILELLTKSVQEDQDRFESLENARKEDNERLNKTVDEVKSQNEMKHKQLFVLQLTMGLINMGGLIALIIMNMPK